jgi:hypothetical protein
LRLDIDKKIGVIVTIFIMIFAAIAVNYSDRTNPTNDELWNLYHAEFDNATILSIIEKPYPKGRGNYRLFRTSSDSSSFIEPLILACFRL